MDKQEQLRILESCHRDPTSGHMGSKRNLARITEWFMWPGVSKDVYHLVSDALDDVYTTSWFRSVYSYWTFIYVRWRLVMLAKEQVGRLARLPQSSTLYQWWHLGTTWALPL